jgi:DNA adenine methylase
MGKTPHLVQYQGSKRNLAVQILEFIPNSFNRLIEPFAGSAAISIACASRNKVQKYLINDLNKPLMELLKLAVEEPDYVIKKYRDIWSNQQYDSIEHYYQIREKFNYTKDPVYFLYLLARCVKGSVRYNTEGLFNQSPDKRRKGTNPLQMEKNILDISSLLKRKITAYTSLDYKDKLSVASHGDIVYIDPPYQGVCGERDSKYFSGIDHEEFTKKIKKLIKRNISFLISYDGQCGNKIYGNEIPIKTGIKRIELNAGRSAQLTLLGKSDVTYESLYVSNDLYFEKNTILKGYDGNELFTRVS